MTSASLFAGIGGSMKALTIQQPYASLIATGAKWVENRGWRTDYRGQLAIHAGKGTQYLTRDEIREQRLPCGVVVAVAELVACHQLSDLRRLHDEGAEAWLAGRSIADTLAHEYTEGPWLWLLANVRRLTKPFPACGKQGLWTLTTDQARCVEENLDRGALRLGEATP